ncbi:PREDICTED: TLD domain-containing protein 2 [Fragaria vesca subsp. vesca]|uniref:TLD domain-containing protein 2 n=1 Tax=Fragaria vesca subsp. vesca TaxID=101020 RepID=UPI0002C31E8C|nr:PREDICTED: TLD domain-containing protein 2 [Fragaria vesca subsp. vesca]
MGRPRSLRSKAAHFVTDITTGLLNPISDKPSKPSPPPPPEEDVEGSKGSQNGSMSEESGATPVDGPDTSSFTAFLYSFLATSESGDKSKSSDEQVDEQMDKSNSSSDLVVKANGGKRSFFSKGKHTLGKAMYQAARFGGYRGQERKGSIAVKGDDGNESEFAGVEMRHLQKAQKPVALVHLPDISEPSLLLTEKARVALYSSFPVLVQGRRWLLLYSTWRHGISLSTLYRRSMLWPGLSLLVVGDRKGAVFGGLVEAPLRPTNKKYQGTNDTFVFTNTSGDPVIYRPTGANRYFTLCATDFLAIGGGGHFALYLNSDLLSGSSSVSETYGNPCLANSEDFDVKEVELWGFVYATKYEEVLAQSRMEAPGICRW